LHAAIRSKPDETWLRHLEFCDRLGLLARDATGKAWDDLTTEEQTGLARPSIGGAIDGSRDASSDAVRFASAMNADV
jgi:hypothetical protein